jgi:riboflavin kinase/FMN adenylyltransferase
MKVIESFDQFDTLQYPVVTSGTFDGVHFGHQKILRGVADQARSHGGESIVITYWPHPRFVLSSDPNKLKLLNTFDERIRFIEACGIDYLVKIPFTRSFSQLSADEYIQNILINGIKTKKLVIGYDHHFGKNQEGNIGYLKERQDTLGFEVEEISRQDIEHVGVSSTKIREALKIGEVDIANEYLGRSYCLHGLVAKGEQLGRKIGFPTANVYVPESYKLIPADGVYAVRVHLGERLLEGMLNIGQRPTVEGQSRTIEVNLFNFDEDIYGLPLTVEFVSFLREERKFENLDELTAQLVQDKARVKEILSNN